MIKKYTLFILSIIFLTALTSCDISLSPATDTNNIESFDRLFDDTKEKKLTIKISELAWAELDSVMLSYYEQFGNYRTDYYVRADLKYEDNQGELLVDEIGFRTRGNLSRTRIVNDEGIPQLSNFKLSFHESFDTDYSKRTVFEIEELDLKFNRNWDETYLTEKFSLDLFKNMGVYAAHTTLVKLYLNIGDAIYYYGVYTAFEPIDQLFLERRLGKDAAQGDLYKSLWQHYGPANLGINYPREAIGIKDESLGYRPSYDLKTNKKTPDFQPIKTFIYDINSKVGLNFESYIAEHFEVSMFLKYLAVGVLLGNPDDYRAMGNNYYLYQNSETLKWGIIPYDYDHGMGQGWDGAPVFTNWSVGMDIYTWGNLNEVFLGIPDYPHVLVDKILSIPKYQLEYEGYLKTLIDPTEDLFDPNVFLSLYETQRSLYDAGIASAMQNQSFGLRQVIQYMNDKIEDISQQLAYYQANPKQG